MKTFLLVCTIDSAMTLPACGSSAEGNTADTASATVDVPVNPLPLSERN